MLVTFDGRDYELRPGESVLDGMARYGVGLPASCRAGSCQACLVRAVRGDPGPGASRGLKKSWQASGYFLACVARPTSDLTVAHAGIDIRVPARLAGVRQLSHEVLRVLVRAERPAGFRPGQHVTLTRTGGPTRCYSVANLPSEAVSAGLEFHVRVYPRGAMSGWLATAAPGAALAVGCPAGECFYTPGDRGGPLLLAGTGTGIAPLIAIARDALEHGHAGPIVLVHGAASPAGLYLGSRRPPALGDHPQVRWRTCVMANGQDIASAVTSEMAAFGGCQSGLRAYLCGGSGAVNRMRRALFLAGMSLGSIMADQFTPAARWAARD